MASSCARRKAALSMKHVANVPIKFLGVGEKIEDLHKLAKALLTYETLTGSEIEDLINKNIYPSSKKDLKDSEEEQGSALGSIGLKPKIVH